MLELEKGARPGFVCILLEGQGHPGAEMPVATQGRKATGQPSLSLPIPLPVFVSWSAWLDEQKGSERQWDEAGPDSDGETEQDRQDTKKNKRKEVESVAEGSGDTDNTRKKKKRTSPQTAFVQAPAIVIGASSHAPFVCFPCFSAPLAQRPTSAPRA